MNWPKVRLAAVGVGLALFLGVPWLLANVLPHSKTYPNPVPGQAVYNTADVLSEATESRAEATIDAIEARTGAEIAVYTLVKDRPIGPEEALGDAGALGNEWGVGRSGFDDGFVVRLQLDPSRCHGQLATSAGGGFRAVYLSDADQQAIRENDAVPYLRVCDLDGAILAVLAKVDLAVTPERASRLAIVRIANALIGLAGLALGALLVAWLYWSWRTTGRDPVFIEDASIHMPAPPPGLTPAIGALVFDGQSSRRTLTTAMLDLASRGKIAFEDESGAPSKKVGIRILDRSVRGPDVTAGRAEPLGSAERLALRELRGLDEDGYVEPDDLLQFGKKVDEFDEELETAAVNSGWFGLRPSGTILRWRVYGGISIGFGVILLGAGFALPSDGLTTAGAALAAAGAVILLSASAMPARTKEGARVRAWLAAYRRSLEKTLAMARSMRQVAAERVLPWVDTPDQAIVWGFALGLHGEVQEVLERSAEDLRSGEPSDAWLPGWWGPAGSGGRSGGPAGIMPGAFSPSAVPNLGAMFAAIGTVGNSPSSSGGGSGGGFGGGGGFSGGGSTGF